MLHRVATKAKTELIAQQMISAMKTPPVCESSTLVKKKHFVVLFVSILALGGFRSEIRDRNDSAKSSSSLFTARKRL